MLRAQNAQTIAAIIYRALAKAELDAPAATRGRFIVGGNTFDAYAVVSKVVLTAKADALLIDPYADASLVTDYAVLASDNVSIRVLARTDRKPLIKPALVHWAHQFKTTRPLDVRLASDKMMHDWLIIVDRSAVYDIGQSFNKLAARAHTTIVRSPAHLEAEKIADRH